MRVLWFACLLVSLAIADDKRFVMVRPTAGLDLLAPGLARHIERLALQVVAQRPQIELLLSGPLAPNASKVDIWVVESEVIRKNDVYEIETRLLDLRGKRLIKNVKRGNILEADLIRLFQAGIEALFIESEKAPPVQAPRTVEAPPDTPDEQTGKPPPQKKINPSPLSPPTPSVVDFRERVRVLKTDVDTEISEVAEEKKEEKAKKKLSSPTRLGSSPAIPKEESQTPFEPKVKSKFKYDLKYDFGLSLEERSISSQGYAVVRGTTNVVTAKAQGFMVVPWKKWDAGLLMEMAIGRISSSPLNISSPYKIALGPALHWKTGFAAVTFAREATHFFGISDFGSGESGGVVKANFLELSGRQCIALWSDELCLEVLFGSLRSATSEFEVVSNTQAWSGSKLRLGLIMPFTLKSWNLAMSLERLQLESEPVVFEFVGVKPFTIQESRIAFSLVRSF